MKRKPEIIPVLLGADLNAYSVAVAFHDAYGVKSYAFGKYKCGLTSFSKIVKQEFCSGYESIDTFLPELFSFAAAHKGKTLILIPCADCYVEFIAENRAVLSKLYKFLIPSDSLLRRLTDKVEFAALLSEHGLPYPDFAVISHNSSNIKGISGFIYPAVLKPSVSAEYWRNPFPGMRKVYYPDTPREAEKMAEKIFYHGYRDRLLLQRKIEDAEIFVYTALFDRESNPLFGVMARVVCEERGVTSDGNHAALITVPPCHLTHSLNRFLHDIGYTGFANLDILRSGDNYYILELNARQGRSCDHIRCAGINIAVMLMRALRLDTSEEKSYGYREIFWHYPSFSTAVSFAERESDARHASELKRRGEEFSALDYYPDLSFNPIRRAYVRLHEGRLKRVFMRDSGALGIRGKNVSGLARGYKRRKRRIGYF